LPWTNAPRSNETVHAGGCVWCADCADALSDTLADARVNNAARAAQEQFIEVGSVSRRKLRRTRAWFNRL